MESTAPEQITRLLGEAVAGDGQAAQELLPLIYDQLRELARLRMTDERAATRCRPRRWFTRLTSALVGDREVPWSGRADFFAAAAEAMRRILIDHARATTGQSAAGAGDAFLSMWWTWPPRTNLPKSCHLIRPFLALKESRRSWRRSCAPLLRRAECR